MSNLFESGDLFEASTRLEYAAACIERLANQEKPDEKAEKALRWAGELLACVDWESGTEERAKVSPDTAFRATSVRPTFYTTLLRMRQEFEESGLKNDRDVFRFLSSLYLLLNDRGTQQPTMMPKARLDLAASFIHEISRDLLLDVCHNGLPTPERTFAFGT